MPSFKRPADGAEKAAPKTTRKSPARSTKAAKPAGPETEALEQWLAPSTSSAIDQVELRLIDEGWAPERAGEAPLDATLAAIQAVGVVEPVLLRPRSGGRFEVVTGHRTVAAARTAGMERVPSVVKELDDVGALMALVFDGSASGQVTAGGAAELRSRLRAAGAVDEDIEDVMGAVVVVEAPAVVAAAEPELVAAAEPELVPVGEPELVPVAEPVGDAQPAHVAAEPLPVGAGEEVAAPELVGATPAPEELEPVAAGAEEAVAAELEPVAAPAEPALVGATSPTPPPESVSAAEEVTAPPALVPAAAAAPAATGGRWLPMPAGRPRLARLSSAFADSPRMLRILSSDRFTGTAELVGRDGRKDAIAFLDGRILATYVEQGERQVDAPLRLPSPEHGPTVEITVRTHPRAVSVALALALRGPARFTGLHAAFLHLDGLLDLLKRESTDAACVVTSTKGTGVILLDRGVPVAAYARRWGDEPSEEAETTDVSAVLDILVSGDGTLDVHTGDAPEALDLDEVIARAVPGD